MKKLLLFFFSFLNVLICSTFAQTTYNDIAPALYKNCTTCHRPGGGAPFSMLTYNDISPWAAAMQTELLSGSMPPWAPDTSYLHFFKERAISPADRDTILAWIADGALQGNPSLLPPPPNYPQYLLNGTPDVVIQMTPFNSNAGIDDAYNNFVISTGTLQGRTIRAIEVVPGNADLVHHAIIMADTAGDILTDTTGNAFVALGDIAVGAYAPGSNPVVFPNSPQLKMGVDIPANADIILNIHTPLGTLGQTITAEVRIYLYPVAEPGIRQVYAFVPLQYWGLDFWLLPGQIKTFSVDQVTYPFDISLYSSFPHSHQICTDILNFAYDTVTLDTVKLMKVNNWDFEHQEYYYYKNLVQIPPGYKFHADHIYDNTATNPHNPFSPPQLITVGTSSTDEMLFDGFQFMVYLPGDEFINVDSILANDPLINYPVAGIEDINSGLNNSYVAPNPVVDKSAIYFVHPHNQWSQYSLHVWSLDGKKIKLPYIIKEGYIEIQKGNLTSGVYLYGILDGEEKLSTGKIVIP